MSDIIAMAFDVSHATEPNMFRVRILESRYPTGSEYGPGAVWTFWAADGMSAEQVSHQARLYLQSWEAMRDLYDANKIALRGVRWPREPWVEPRIHP